MFRSVCKVPVVQLNGTKRITPSPSPPKKNKQKGQIISNSFQAAVGKGQAKKQVVIVGRYVFAVFAFPSSVCFVRSKDSTSFFFFFLTLAVSSVQEQRTLHCDSPNHRLQSRGPPWPVLLDYPHCSVNHSATAWCHQPSF